MADLIEIKKMGGIKCDNPDCDYRDETVKVEDYSNWLDRPCPKCGNNLLTKEDYKSFKKLLSLIKVINKIGRLLPKKTIKKLEEEPKELVHIGWNGSGKFSIKDKTEC